MASMAYAPYGYNAPPMTHKNSFAYGMAGMTGMGGLTGSHVDLMHPAMSYSTQLGKTA